MNTIEWHSEEWLSDSEINKIEYSTYWNDEELEKNKDWYILDGDFSKMERHLRKAGLPHDLMRCIETLRTDFKRQVQGIGMDLAAGNLWAAPYLFKLGTVDKLYCVEYSKHRLLRIGPRVLDHYAVPKKNVVLALGNFYDLHVSDNSIDFIFMSQAFHHADDPIRLLEEIRRVLRPNGVVIIIGEHIVNYRRPFINGAIKFLISVLVPKKIQKMLIGKTFDVKTIGATLIQAPPPDPILGDHYYTDDAYRLMFSRYNFEIKRLKNRDSHFQSFLLVGQ